MGSTFKSQWSGDTWVAGSSLYKAWPSCFLPTPGPEIPLWTPGPSGHQVTILLSLLTSLFSWTLPLGNPNFGSTFW